MENQLSKALNKLVENLVSKKVADETLSYNTKQVVFLLIMIIAFPCTLLLITLSSLHPLLHCQATTLDTLKAQQSLSDGQTLVSSNNLFELGFFSPGKDGVRYLGIWYKDIVPLTVVWVANRNDPLEDSPGHLNLSDDGVRLYNAGNTLVWLLRIPLPILNLTLQLLDSGNLVLRPETDPGSNGFVWQSFDNPVDTWLPGMKLGWNLTDHSNRYLTSWRSQIDPGTGEFKFAIETSESPQLLIFRRNVVEYRWGPWNGVMFSGNKELKNNLLFDLVYEVSYQGVYYMLQPREDSVISRLVASPLGSLDFLTWRKKSNEWITKLKIQGDSCDQYGICGINGVCDMDRDPKCQCLNGFIPRSPNEWDALDWLGGCQRRSELKCGSGEGFVRFTGLKLPDYSSVVTDRNLTMIECQEACLRDCSCMAYAYLNVHGNGSQCVIWFGDLLDIRVFLHGGDELYVKMAHEEIEAAIARADDMRETKTMIIVVCVVLALLALGIIGWFIPSMATNKTTASERVNSYIATNENGEEDVELPLFDLKVISDATNGFSSNNIIGKGGFGPVYKGVLPDGEEIAVKRLSRFSIQGLQEFINEVILISKLQHRNLVKIMGCCVDGEERLLIFEHMPNRSLDQFLFDKKKRAGLAWKNRLNIIVGVARALIYLHEDSRCRIIHRDLKASNILLDSEMNPKVSDFGIARTLGGDEAQSTTARVFGTHGYMSPEYAFSGQFSVKSDAFSFGVLTLEIISGKRNWKFRHPDHDFNLIGHAWELWRKGKALELMDETIMNNTSSEEEDQVLRCINVALLCVQPRPEDRPTMSIALHMLQADNNASAALPSPNEPGICASGSTSTTAAASSSSHIPHGSCSTINMVEITTMEVR
ncbi:hypothetical protein Dimus_035158 [Dionaea muscipula]